MQNIIIIYPKTMEENLTNLNIALWVRLWVCEWRTYPNYREPDLLKSLKRCWLKADWLEEYSKHLILRLPISDIPLYSILFILMDKRNLHTKIQASILNNSCEYPLNVPDELTDWQLELKYSFLHKWKCLPQFSY